MKKSNRKMATSMDEINAAVQVVFRSNYRNNSTCSLTFFDIWKHHQLQLASNLILTLFGLMFASLSAIKFPSVILSLEVILLLFFRCCHVSELQV